MKNKTMSDKSNVGIQHEDRVPKYQEIASVVLITNATISDRL